MKLWPVVLCLLCSCAAIQPSDNASLSIQEKSVVFASGSGDAGMVKLFLFGDGLRFNDRNCKAYSGHVECSLGVVPSGKQYRVSVVGADRAEVFYRKAGTLFTLSVSR